MVDGLASATCRFGLCAWMAVLLTAAVPRLSDAEPATGTATYQRKSGGPVQVTLKHVYLVKGPEIGTGKIIRRLVFSTVDVRAALQACQSMMCSDGGIDEGLTIDFDSGPRLNYWFVADGQRVQYSGTAAPATATLTTDSASRLAGRFAVDATVGGGPVVDVEFDATSMKELKK